MASESVMMDSSESYSLLRDCIPKDYTETNSYDGEDVLIDLDTSQDSEMGMISVLCNIKFMGNYDFNVPLENIHEFSFDTATSDFLDTVHDPTTSSIPHDVWIEPVCSPMVYEEFSSPVSQYLSHDDMNISDETALDLQNADVNQNIYNNDVFMSDTQVDDELEDTVLAIQKEFDITQQNILNQYLSENYDIESDLFLPTFAEEIINEQCNEIEDEEKHIEEEEKRIEEEDINIEEEYKNIDKEVNSDNTALKQLMSIDTQCAKKQRKTILFMGHDSQFGQTVQKISVNNPTLSCSGSTRKRIVYDGNHKFSHKKKYQCEKCNHIFDKLSEFKQHMKGKHQVHKPVNKSVGDNNKLMCEVCQKCLKSQEKLQAHYAAHGNPELECNKCFKVFASKFTLRTHQKIHLRKYRCDYCTKSFAKPEDFNKHYAKNHSKFVCELCEQVLPTYARYEIHIKNHVGPKKSALKHLDIEEFDMEDQNDIDFKNYEIIRKADLDIAKVMSDQAFFLNPESTKRINKTCVICEKRFDRISDLKRHLIEHVVKCTLAKTPVSKDGTLFIRCDECKVETFTKIDKYKAHLREHAKLTLYECTLCEKSFSDSSNFSKHKKIHGSVHFQCDLCQRKFNSKKMITQHMDYHEKNPIINCNDCNKSFYFQSNLNKHIKSVHSGSMRPKFKCKFCCQYFNSLKLKWDHEWITHKVRKMIADCLICHSKYRKYSDLKRHCLDEHKVPIPPAKNLLKRGVKAKVLQLSMAYKTPK